MLGDLLGFFHHPLAQHDVLYLLPQYLQSTFAVGVYVMTVEVVRVTAEPLMTAVTMGKGVHTIVSDALLGPAKVMATVQAHAVFFVFPATTLAGKVISHPDAPAKPVVCCCTL